MLRDFEKGDDYDAVLVTVSLLKDPINHILLQRYCTVQFN